MNEPRRIARVIVSIATLLLVGLAAVVSAIATGERIQDPLSSFWWYVQIGSNVAIGVFAVSGVLLLWRLGERFSSAPPPLAAAATQIEVRELTIVPEAQGASAQFVRSFRQQTLAILALLALVLALFWKTWTSDWRLALPVLGLVLLSASTVGPGATRLVDRLKNAPRLATDGEHAVLVKGGRIVHFARWHETYTDGRHLLLGRCRVRLFFGTSVPRYDQEALAGLILARVPPSNRLSSAPMQWLLLSRTSDGRLEAVIAIVLLAMLTAHWSGAFELLTAAPSSMPPLNPK